MSVPSVAVTSLSSCTAAALPQLLEVRRQICEIHKELHGEGNDDLQQELECVEKASVARQLYYIAQHVGHLTHAHVAAEFTILRAMDYIEYTEHQHSGSGLGGTIDLGLGDDAVELSTFEATVIMMKGFVGLGWMSLAYGFGKAATLGYG